MDRYAVVVRIADQSVVWTMAMVLAVAADRSQYRHADAEAGQRVVPPLLPGRWVQPPRSSLADALEASAAGTSTWTEEVGRNARSP